MLVPYRFARVLIRRAVVVTMLRAAVCWSATITFDFAQSDFGWIPGFADYPSDADPDFYELQSDYRNRPANLGGDGSIFISGNNHSDDLFMFIKKSLAGLTSNTLYKLTIHVELASQYPTGLGGIGGSPGDSVYLKAGGSTIEPDTVIQDWGYGGYYRMNIDKGNQSEGGQDVLVLGTIAKPDDGTFDYVLIERDNATNPIYAWSGASGQLWLLVGTDSGFEGTTSIYYTKITVEVDPVLNPLRLTRQNDTITLEWDAGILQTAATLLDEWTDVPGATSPRQESVSGVAQKFWRLRPIDP
jgi:hypothetical protein